MTNFRVSRFALTFLIGVATTITRLLGFARDVLLAALFGAGPVADAFFVALRLPNMIRRLMGEGAWASGYVPIIHRLKREGQIERVREFEDDSLLWIIGISIISLVMFAAAANPLMNFFAPGLSPQIRDHAISYFRALVPLIAGVILTGYFSALLVSRHKFVGQALIPLLTNAGLVLLLISYLREPQSDAVGQGLLLCWIASGLTFIQVLWLGYFLRRDGQQFSVRLPRANKDTLALLRLVAPGFFIQFSTQFGFIVVSMSASAYPAMISHLTYADRLVQLPLGFISAGLATIALTDFAERLVAPSKDALHHAIDRAMVLALALSVPAMIGLVLLADPIIAVLFERGAFTPTDREDTARALIGLSWGLPFVALARVQMQVYFVREQIRVPLLAACAGLLAILALLTLIPKLDNVFELALILTAGTVITAAIHVWGFERLCSWRPQKSFRLDLAKLSLACLLLALALYAAREAFGRDEFHHLAFFPQAAIVIGICCGGGALYAGLFAMFGLGRYLR